MSVRALPGLGCLLGIPLLALGFAGRGTTESEARLGNDPAIAPYVTYLREHPVGAKQFILDLFEKYDLVVLAERDHGETTQWEFIFDLIRDPAFSSRVGYLFTEYGSVDQQPDLEAFLNADHLEDSRILALLRDFILWPEGWDNNNLFEFMRKFYAWNRSVPAERRIAWYFSDIPWKWTGMTRAEYKAQTDLAQAGRDEIMALRIRYRFEEILRSPATRKKALVIMNTRHAFKVPLKKGDAFFYDNLGSALVKWQPTAGRTAFVMMNYIHSFRPGAGGISQAPVHDGKWDAAFAACGNAPRGVSFHDSPFGRDAFDYLGFEPLKVQYRDVFDGMVFYQPLEKHRLHNDIPGFHDDAFKAVVLRRAELNNSVDAMKELFKERQEHPEKYGLRPAYDQKTLQPISKWLER
ncbi:MAG TPA: hypothetical protein VK395_35855 [Gemmataceae bacterium]|nr:hypothetical protein [Gemmataceae bacterium]